MNNVEKHLEVAELYLQEMFKADDSKDFDLYRKRYEAKYLENFNEDIFSNDIKHMHERNGMNQGYEFLGILRSAEHDGNTIFRTVWKGVYEKRDAVVEMGVYEKAGSWFVIKSAVY